MRGEYVEDTWGEVGGTTKVCPADPNSWWVKELVMPVQCLLLDKISTENHVRRDPTSDFPFSNAINSGGEKGDRTSIFAICLLGF